MESDVVAPAPACFPVNSTWGNSTVGDQKGRGSWTEEENKVFENALAHIDGRTPDRWERVAAMLPGKTVREVVSHYRDLEDDVGCIEAGMVPCPGYSSISFGWEGGCDGESCCVGGKRGRLGEQEGSKGVPWTEEEHKAVSEGTRQT